MHSLLFQQLTAAIFGVSTLLSSYQIYNVSRQVLCACHGFMRILPTFRGAPIDSLRCAAGWGFGPPCAQVQEDNLQHLALFTEYGRLAFRNDTESKQPEVGSACAKDRAANVVFCQNHLGQSP